MHPILAIDHGEARIGIAATDEFGIAAHPVETIDCAMEIPLDRIAQLVVERRIQTLLLGLPLKSDGREGTAAQKVRSFGEELAKRCPEPELIFTDESFSTIDASAKLRQAGRKSHQQRDVIDQAAALEILQRYLGWNF